MKIRLLGISLCVLMSTAMIKAEEINKDFSNVEKKHSVQISMSDGLTLSGTRFWGIGTTDVVAGRKHSDQKNSGVFGIGYRYSIKKFKIGGDIGFAKITSKTTLVGENTLSLQEEKWNFMILSAVEYIYYKHKLVKLYGATSIGLDFTRHQESGLTDRGKKVMSAKSRFGTQFTYQVNPIGLRVENDQIGIFIEAGLGYRGFCTAGISLNF